MGTKSRHARGSLVGRAGTTASVSAKSHRLLAAALRVVCIRGRTCWVSFESNPIGNQIGEQSVATNLENACPGLFFTLRLL